MLYLLAEIMRLVLDPTICKKHVGLNYQGINARGPTDQGQAILEPNGANEFARKMRDKINSPANNACLLPSKAIVADPHCSETKFNPNVPQLTSSLQIIKSYIYTCHFNKKSKYFTESFTRYCPCTLGACVHAHLEKFLDFVLNLQSMS